MARRRKRPHGYTPITDGAGDRSGDRPLPSSYPTPITDAGHGPMHFGAEAGPAKPSRYTRVNPVRTVKPVRRKK